MRWLVCLILTGCVSQIYEPGGTLGPPALRCRDATCERVVHALELRRHNIGNGCGTPNVRAHGALVELGTAAVPYLVAAFDDRDTEVAELAMEVTVQLGAVDPVVEWCRGAHDLVRIDMCRRAL
jgi:hypothetical protein